jgi:hypothetical protein
MPTPFGPQLIGETEKTLNALLHRALEGTGLSEPQWVTLRIAQTLDGSARDAASLVTAARDRAHFRNAERLVAELNARDLVAGGALTPGGRELVATIQARIAASAGSIWKDLPADDVAAATRVLNEVVARARAVLA